MLKNFAAGLVMLGSLAAVPAFAQTTGGTAATPPAVSPSEPGRTALGDTGPALGAPTHTRRRRHAATKPVDQAPDGTAPDRAEAGGGGR